MTVGEAWSALVNDGMGARLLETRGVPREVAEAAVIGVLTEQRAGVGWAHPESWLHVHMWSEPWAAVRR